MLGATQSSTVSAEDIKAMVIALQDITATLAEALARRSETIEF